MSVRFVGNDSRRQIALLRTAEFTVELSPMCAVSVIRSVLEKIT